MKAVVCSLFLVFTTTVTGAQERRSPPVDVPIISRNEKGDNELTVIYHSSGTCDIAATRGGQWHCSWTLKPNGEFCFAQDGGADKGKLICKQQRLIGRVNLDGTPLSYSQSCPQMDRRNPASKSAIQSVVVGHTLRTDLGDLTQHFMAYFTYGSDGAYTYRTPNKFDQGRYEVEDGFIDVTFANGFTRCDGITINGNSISLIDKIGHSYSLTIVGG